MSSTSFTPLTGGCACSLLRYRLSAPPFITQCCHCTRCQRESGSAFAHNALVDASAVTLLPHITAEPVLIPVPARSGVDQRIAHCPACFVAVWSEYGGTGHLMRAVKVGTLDEPGRVPPDVHIFVEAKQPWVVLPEGARVFEASYKKKDVWARESLERWEEVVKRVGTWKAEKEKGQGKL